MRARMMSGETIHTDSHRSAWRDDQLHLQSEYVTCMIVDSFFLIVIKHFHWKELVFKMYKKVSQHNVKKSQSQQSKSKKVKSESFRKSKKSICTDPTFFDLFSTFSSG